MYKSKIGRVIDCNTHGNSQEIKIKEIGSWRFWKTYYSEFGLGHNKLTGHGHVVQFLVDEHDNVLAVRDLGAELDNVELYQHRCTLV